MNELAVRGLRDSMNNSREFGDCDFIDEPLALVSKAGFEPVDVSKRVLEMIGCFPGQLGAVAVPADHAEFDALWIYGRLVTHTWTRTNSGPCGE